MIITSVVERSMKISRKGIRFGLSVLTVLVAGAIGPRDSVRAQARLQVVTTFIPITNFTKAVAGNRAEVKTLIPTNVGPHDFQAKPSDVQALASARVLVKNGLQMEGFLDGLVKSAANRNLTIIDTSKGVPLIKNDDVKKNKTGFRPDPSAAYAHKKHDHGGEFNPHIWLDPKRAIKQVENIRDGLIKVDPQGRDIYTRNAAAYIDQLKAMDAEFTAALKPFRGKTFVTYHDFAPYFAQSYGLKSTFLIGVPDENPSPNDVRRVITEAQRSGLRTLLTEPQAGSGGPLDALAKDLGVGISQFDPIETGPAESVDPSYYLRVMRQNVKNLQAAFSGKPVSRLDIPVQIPVAWGAEPVAR